MLWLRVRIIEVRIIEGPDNRGQDNRGSTVLPRVSTGVFWWGEADYEYLLGFGLEPEELSNFSYSSPI